MIKPENIQSNHDALGLSDVHIAKLYGGLNKVNGAIMHLENAPMFGEVERAKTVINMTRDLMAKMVFTMHIMKNDIEKLKGERNA
jgi:hypothetical protein